MHAKLQRRIQRYGWDKAASVYEDGWRDSLRDAQSCLLQMADAQPGESVLDMACGTGLVTFPLANAVGKTGHVVATDISERMIDIMQEEASLRGHTQIDARRADAETQDGLDDNQFDLVTCALGLMYVPNPLHAMSEALRLLKPGGRAVFAVWGARKSCGWADIFPIVDARVESDVCPMFFRLGTGETLACEMEEAGFHHIGQRNIETVLPYDDDQSALQAAFVGGPVALAYDRFDDATRKAAHEDYLQSIAPYRTEKGYRIPGSFVVCHGTKPMMDG